MKIFTKMLGTGGGMTLFDDCHYEWLAARIRELPLTSVDAGSRQRLTVRDVVARKLARDLQIHNFALQRCPFSAGLRLYCDLFVTGEPVRDPCRGQKVPPYTSV